MHSVKEQMAKIIQEQPDDYSYAGLNYDNYHEI